MEERKALIAMLHQLLKEMDVVQSQGAGYYTCAPFARRFNKLLSQAESVMASAQSLLGTFAPLEEIDPNDPTDKIKVLQEIRIEAGQLITLLEVQKDAATEGES